MHHSAKYAKKLPFLITPASRKGLPEVTLSSLEGAEQKHKLVKHSACKKEISNSEDRLLKGTRWHELSFTQFTQAMAHSGL